jgi:hypothetical protein
MKNPSTHTKKVKKEPDPLEHIKDDTIEPKVDPVGQIIENRGYWRSRLVIGTPVTGLVRIEWVTARYGQIIPTNWSAAEIKPFIDSVAPLRFLVADAQNIIVQKAIEQGAEFLLLIEQDDVLPPDAYIRFNTYMIEKKVPVVSGLYFTKSIPPEPMTYRKWGDGYYDKWKLGDKVWCRGVPTGCLLIHCSILKAMYDESPIYNAGGMMVRRVFETPEKVWFNQETGILETSVGTSDLHWCNRVIEGKFLEKAGWPEYQKMDSREYITERYKFYQQLEKDVKETTKKVGLYSSGSNFNNRLLKQQFDSMMVQVL